MQKNGTSYTQVHLIRNTDAPTVREPRGMMGMGGMGGKGHFMIVNKPKSVSAFPINKKKLFFKKHGEK